MKIQTIAIEEAGIVMQFLAHENRAFIRFSNLRLLHLRDVCGEDTNRRQRLRAFIKCVRRFHLFIDSPDQANAVHFQRSVWRELIANGHGSPHGLRPEALELQRRLWLDASKIAPRRLETPRHTQPGLPPI